jgi:uncharacterized membrane protein YeiH
MPLFIASMMGVITGIFGGVLRDIVCNEVPMVFRDGKPYAICAFLGNWMFLLMGMYTACRTTSRCGPARCSSRVPAGGVEVRSCGWGLT